MERPGSERILDVRMNVSGIDEQRRVGGEDIEGLLRALRRQGWLIALCVVLATGTALGLSLAQQKQYTASASLLFGDSGLDQQLFGNAGAPTGPTDRQITTDVELVKAPGVLARVTRTLGGADAAALSNRVHVVTTS